MSCSKSKANHSRSRSFGNADERLLLDSSALVKRFARETGSAFVLDLLRPARRNTIYVASVTEVETFAALARRRKSKTLTAARVAKSQRRCRRDFARRYTLVALNAAVIDEAVSVADHYEIRGYDAVQLASALLANRARLLNGFPALILVSADSDLNQAAQAEGLSVEDPNNYP